MRYTTFSSLLFAALLGAAPLQAQTAYKGKVVVSDSHFVRQGDLLRVHFAVDYGTDVASPGETLTLTPVLKNDSMQHSLSAVVIKGDDLKGSRRRLQGNYPVAAAGKQRKKGCSFVYDTTVPYAAWMDGAGLFIESNRTNGKTNHSYEDRILTRVPLDSMSAPAKPAVTSLPTLQNCVQYVSPAQESTKVRTVSGEMPLSSDFISSRSFEKKVYDHLMGVVKERAAGQPLSGVTIHAYGAPAGNYKRNERLAVLHQLDLKEYLMRQKTTRDALCRVQWTAEDWDSIARIVRGSGMRYRNAVLDIIHTTDVAAGREDQLRELAAGEPYKYLRQNVFGRVYRLQYTLSFRTPDADRITGAATVDNAPSQLDYASLFGVAKGYGIGSERFRELLTTGANLFPNSPEACINAAAVAITEGRYSRARQLLAPYTTDERAFCNLGILYALTGEKDRADVYLRMAEKNGVEEASRALAAMKH